MATVGHSVGRDVRRRRENVVEHGLGASRRQGREIMASCNQRKFPIQYIHHTRGAMGYPPPLNYGQSVNLTPVKLYPQGLHMVLNIARIANAFQVTI